MKKRLNKITLIIALLSVCTISIAQVRDTIPWTGEKLVNAGNSLYDNDQFKEALKIYDRVPQCDPYYPTACYEKALTFQAMDSTKLALTYILEADSLEPGLLATNILLGSIYDDLTERQKAIEIFERARKLWPYSHGILYNLAIVYANMKDYNKAEELLIECVKISPYHAGTHILLAKINHYRGRFAEAVLAYNMGFIMNNKLKVAINFEEMVADKLPTTPDLLNYPYPNEFDATEWKRLSKFCASGLAFKTDFPINTVCTYNINRQSYLLFSLMQFNEKDKTIYNQFYLRFFKDIYNNGMTNALFAYQLQNLESKDVQNWIKNNKSKTNDFIEFTKNSINSMRTYAFDIENEKNGVKTRIFNDEGKLFLLATEIQNPEPKLEGPYIQLNNDGSIASKGSYKNGKINGETIQYWANGNVKQKLNYLDGELHEKNSTFYKSGNISGFYPRNKGEREGKEVEYFKSGEIASNKAYINDKSEGEHYQSYKFSNYTITSNYLNNLLSGTYQEKWTNGKLKVLANYKDSILDGKFQSWNSHGTLEVEFNYKKGEIVGPYSRYHSNGKLSISCTYNDSSKLEGKYTKYYRDGKISLLQDGYKNGILNGTSTAYYENGQKQNEFLYEDDKPIKITAYNTEGGIIYQSEAKNGEILFKSFYDTGALKREGLFKDGKNEGEWKDYSSVGNIIGITNYKNDLLQGQTKTFYENGQIKAEKYYENDTLVGVCKEYHENGNLSIKYSVDKGENTGEVTRFYNNGKIESNYYLNDNNLDGRYFEYSPEGVITSISTYSDNDLKKIALFTNGKLQKVIPYDTDSLTVELFFPNGKKQSQYKLKDGLREGSSEMYYPTGQLLSRAEYLNGKLNGNAMVWSIDGKLERKNTYTYNQRDGYQYSYTDGKINTKDYMEEGVSQDKFIEYFANGKPSRIIPYTDNERNGEYPFFSTDSILAFAYIYEEGVITALKIRNKEGKIQTIPTNMLKAEATNSYYPNGMLAACVPLKNGLLDGKLLVINTNGKTLRERNYKNNLLHGETKIYHINGILSEIENYSSNQQTGKYTRYFENGFKAEEGEYLCDTQTGKWTIYDLKGNKKCSIYYENGQIYAVE